ncbi:MAG: MarR family transcriptional regulator [Roseinatronobacter sp.]
MNRCGNLLTAAATAICDAQASAMAERANLNPSTTAAILTLGQHAAQSVSELAVVSGITHSAMVRLVESLKQRGLVTRAQGRNDRREAAISLTEPGQALYATLREMQTHVIAPLLEGLTAEDQAVLETALTHILTKLTTGRESADHICRFCDEVVCGQDHCPVEQQACRLTQA